MVNLYPLRQELKELGSPERSNFSSTTITLQDLDSRKGAQGVSGLSLEDHVDV